MNGSTKYPSDASHLNNSEVNAPSLELTGSPHIIDWLHGLEISLAFTTYQTCRLFLLGIKPNGRLGALLYDVQLLPGVKRPMTLGFQSEEIRRLITLDLLGTLPIHNQNSKLQET